LGASLKHIVRRLAYYKCGTKRSHIYLDFSTEWYYIAIFLRYLFEHEILFV